MVQDNKKMVYCSGCGIEIDPVAEEEVSLDNRPYCLWCWNNDNCRISKDAAEKRAGGSEDVHLCPPVKVVGK